MPLAIIVEDPNEKTKLLTLQGQLDATTAQDLADILNVQITAPIIFLVLDLAELDFISSAGLRVIFKVEKTLKAQGGKLFMIKLQPQVRKVFQIVMGSAVPITSIVKDLHELDEYLAGIQEKVKAGDMDAS